MKQRGAAFLLLAVAAFMLLGILLNLGQGFGVAAYALALLFCVALPAGLGFALLRSPGTHLRLQQADRAWHSELLRLAERHGGNLTVREVMIHTGLPPDDAERRLERFCKQGLAEHCVADEGVIVYRFERILTHQQKQRAVGVLDD